jgi:hypothetical protein
MVMEQKVYIENVIEIVEKLFPKSDLIRRDYKLSGYELEFRTQKSLFLLITIAFYERIVMHIDEFDIEFDQYSRTSLDQLEKYLYAIKEDKLIVKTRRLLGIPIIKSL